MFVAGTVLPIVLALVTGRSVVCRIVLSPAQNAGPTAASVPAVAALPVKNVIQGHAVHQIVQAKSVDLMAVAVLAGLVQLHQCATYQGNAAAAHQIAATVVDQMGAAVLVAARAE